MQGEKTKEAATMPQAQRDPHAPRTGRQRWPLLLGVLFLSLAFIREPSAQTTGTRLGRAASYPSTILRFDEPSEIAAARAALARGEPEEAIRQARRLLASDRTPAIRYVALNALCAGLTQAKRFEEAGAACNEAVRLRPKYWMAHNTLGNLHLVQRRFEAAIAEYRMALETLRPRTGAARIVRRNLALAEQERAQDAGS